MRRLNFTEARFGFPLKIVLRAMYQIRMRSGAAHTKFIWNAEGFQAASLPIGYRPKPNSEKGKSRKHETTEESLRFLNPDKRLGAEGDALLGVRILTLYLGIGFRIMGCESGSCPGKPA